MIFFCLWHIWWFVFSLRYFISFPHIHIYIYIFTLSSPPPFFSFIDRYIFFHIFQTYWHITYYYSHTDHLYFIFVIAIFPCHLLLRRHYIDTTYHIYITPAAMMMPSPFLFLSLLSLFDFIFTIYMPRHYLLFSFLLFILLPSFFIYILGCHYFRHYYSRDVLFISYYLERYFPFHASFSFSLYRHDFIVLHIFSFLCR